MARGSPLPTRRWPSWPRPAHSPCLTLNSSGAARTDKTGPISLSTHRPSTFKRRYTPRRSSTHLKRHTAEKREAQAETPDLFADFNGITPEQRAEFYQHDQHWSNRMILGDSLQVMASLSERESLKGKVQCI